LEDARELAQRGDEHVVGQRERVRAVPARAVVVPGLLREDDHSYKGSTAAVAYTC